MRAAEMSKFLLPFPMPPGAPVHARRLAALLGLIAIPSIASAQLTAYGPFAARYRMTNRVSSTQSMMGQTQTAETTADQFVSTNIRAEGGGLTLSMVFDSAAFSSNPPGLAPDAQSAFGMMAKGQMDADGKVRESTVTGRDGGPATSPLASNFRSFFPRVRVGAVIGATWADSSSTNSQQNGITLTTTTVSTWTYAGDTTVGGTKAAKLTATSVGSIVGTGNQGGADLTLKGEVRTNNVMVVGAGGMLLGGTSASEASLTVDVPAASMQIPITQSLNTKIERIP